MPSLHRLVGDANRHIRKCLRVPYARATPLSGDAVVSRKFRIPSQLVLAALFIAMTAGALLWSQNATQAKPAENAEAGDSKDSDASKKKADTGPMKSETFS